MFLCNEIKIQPFVQKKSREKRDFLLWLLCIVVGVLRRKYRKLTSVRGMGMTSLIFEWDNESLLDSNDIIFRLRNYIKVFHNISGMFQEFESDMKKKQF